MMRLLTQNVEILFLNFRDKKVFDQATNGGGAFIREYSVNVWFHAWYIYMYMYMYTCKSVIVNCFVAKRLKCRRVVYRMHILCWFYNTGKYGALQKFASKNENDLDENTMDRDKA